MNIKEVLGPHYRDYLKMGWRIAKSYKRTKIPATFKFIMEKFENSKDILDNKDAMLELKSTDKLKYESLFIIGRLNNHSIQIIKNRDDIKSTVEFINDYLTLYNMNTDLIPSEQYIKNKTIQGLAVEFALHLKSVHDEYMNIIGIDLKSKHSTSKNSNPIPDRYSETKQKTKPPKYKPPKKPKQIKKNLTHKAIGKIGKLKGVRKTRKSVIKKI